MLGTFVLKHVLKTQVSLFFVRMFVRTKWTTRWYYISLSFYNSYAPVKISNQSYNLITCSKLAVCTYWTSDLHMLKSNICTQLLFHHIFDRLLPVITGLYRGSFFFLLYDVPLFNQSFRHFTFWFQSSVHTEGRMILYLWHSHLGSGCRFL